jgi:hypothetical protein
MDRISALENFSKEHAVSINEVVSDIDDQGDTILTLV